MLSDWTTLKKSHSHGENLDLYKRGARDQAKFTPQMTSQPSQLFLLGTVMSNRLIVHAASSVTKGCILDKAAMQPNNDDKLLM